MELTFLSRTPLFRNMSTQDISAMLECLRAREQSYAKGQIIYHAGDRINAMGMVENKLRLPLVPTRITTFEAMRKILNELNIKC